MLVDFDGDVCIRKAEHFLVQFGSVDRRVFWVELRLVRSNLDPLAGILEKLFVHAAAAEDRGAGDAFYS